jgi:hypothetical protein
MSCSFSKGGRDYKLVASDGFYVPWWNLVLLFLNDVFTTAVIEMKYKCVQLTCSRCSSKVHYHVAASTKVC